MTPTSPSRRAIVDAPRDRPRARRGTFRRGARTALIVATAAIVSAAPCACEKSTRVHGQRDVEATYVGRTLTAELPDEARVPAVIAAAEQTFRARGYAIRDGAMSEEEGSVVGIPPNTTEYPRVEVTARRTSLGTQVDIRYLPLGEEQLSRSILDGILKRLGM